jgi:hypothetical protein
VSDPLPEQRYGPTSGGISGVLGLVVSAVLIASSFAGGITLAGVRFGLAAALGGVLVWAYLLRPRIVIESGGHTLLLRNPFVDIRIPIATVRVVAVKAVTSVTTEDERRYDAVAVGYSVRNIVRGQRTVARIVDRPIGLGMSEPTQRPAAAHLPDQPVQQLMTEQILAAADRARDARAPGGPAKRSPAMLELLLAVGLAAGLVATFFF